MTEHLKSLLVGLAAGFLLGAILIGLVIAKPGVNPNYAYCVGFMDGYGFGKDGIGIMSFPNGPPHQLMVDIELADESCMSLLANKQFVGLRSREFVK